MTLRKRRFLTAPLAGLALGRAGEPLRGELVSALTVMGGDACRRGVPLIDLTLLVVSVESLLEFNAGEPSIDVLMDE